MRRTIRVILSSDSKYYFIVIAKNGQVLATSETYTRKSNCIKGIKALTGILKGKVKVE